MWGERAEACCDFSGEGEVRSARIKEEAEVMLAEAKGDNGGGAVADVLDLSFLRRILWAGCDLLGGGGLVWFVGSAISGGWRGGLSGCDARGVLGFEGVGGRGEIADGGRWCGGGLCRRGGGGGVSFRGVGLCGSRGDRIFGEIGEGSSLFFEQVGHASDKTATCSQDGVVFADLEEASDFLVERPVSMFEEGAGGIMGD